MLTLLIIAIALLPIRNAQTIQGTPADDGKISHSGETKRENDSEQSSFAEKDVLVTLKQGVIRGYKEKALNGRNFYSFRSIPFAIPPVGALRFKDPVPLASWDGVLNGSKPLEYCIQYPLLEITKEDKFSAVHTGSEDCLYLNVFSSKPNNIEAKLPVMVYIHKGGFFFGGGIENPPYVLMGEEIVLVVIQYRIGVFGFLSTEDEVLPGNLGLKDQQLALKWVQQNIENFGGNPKQVTLFGQSAGAASAHMHMLIPSSKGLFHRVIAQSGSALCPWAFVENHRQFAAQIGQMFNCSLGNDSNTYVECMQNVPALNLLQAMALSMKWGFNQLYVLPRIDGVLFADRPEVLIKEGKYTKVDLISGICRDEGALLYATILRNPDMIQTLNEDFKTFGPLSTHLVNEQNPSLLAKQIFHHYLMRNYINITIEDGENMVKLFSDSYNVMPHEFTSLLHASDSDMNVYTYQFDHRGKLSMTDVFLGPGSNNWIGHIDDLIYLFSGGPLFFRPLQDEQDLEVRNLMVSLWTNFAKTGNPTPSGAGFVWQKATPDKFNHLSITPSPKMETDKRQKIRDFWLSLDLKMSKNLRGMENTSKGELQKENEVIKVESSISVVTTTEKTSTATAVVTSSSIPPAGTSTRQTPLRNENLFSKLLNCFYQGYLSGLRKEPARKGCITSSDSDLRK